MSARLITGRPLIAGIGTTSSRGVWGRRHGKQPSTWPRPRADLGILARRQVASPRWQPVVFYNSGQVSRRLMPPVVAFRGVAGPGGRRDLCRGAVRSAALRGGPVGRRLPTPGGATWVDLGSRTTSPSFQVGPTQPGRIATCRESATGSSRCGSHVRWNPTGTSSSRMTGPTGAGIMSGMQRFVDDDNGYLDWLDHHPDGFVINTGRTPSAAYLMLHRASCGTISGKPARGTTFMGEYAKVCGERNELEEFARHLGGHAQPCRSCLAQRGQPGNPTPQAGSTAPCVSTSRPPPAPVCI